MTKSDILRHVDWTFSTHSTGSVLRMYFDCWKFGNFLGNFGKSFYCFPFFKTLNIEIIWGSGLLPLNMHLWVSTNRSIFKTVLLTGIPTSPCFAEIGRRWRLTPHISYRPIRTSENSFGRNLCHWWRKAYDKVSGDICLCFWVIERNRGHSHSHPCGLRNSSGLVNTKRLREKGYG